MQTVKISIHGGVVQGVECPPGVKVIVCDYDIEDDDLNTPNIFKDKEGYYYYKSEYLNKKRQNTINKASRSKTNSIL